MDYHYHARLTIVRREELAKGVLEGRLSLKEAMAEFKLSRQSAAKWVRRYREQGVAGLRDRTSRPHRSPRSTPEERWTGVRIAQQLGLSRATVSCVLRRLGLNRIRDLEPAPAVVRYEHAAPGDMLHLDIKRLVRIQRPSHRVTGDRRDGVRGIGAEFLHVAVDDHSRLAFTAMDQDQTSAVRFTSSPPRSPGSNPSASASVACSPTTAHAIRPTAFTVPALSFTSSTGERGPTPRAPTEKQNASSKPRSTSGPTHISELTRPNFLAAHLDTPVVLVGPWLELAEPFC